MSMLPFALHQKYDLKASVSVSLHEDDLLRYVSHVLYIYIITDVIQNTHVIYYDYMLDHFACCLWAKYGSFLVTFIHVM